MFMRSNFSVSANTPRKALDLSTEIVWGKPKRYQIFINTEAKAVALPSSIDLKIANDVMPHAEIR